MSNKRSSRNTKKVLKALKHKREKYNLGKLAGIGKYANSPRARAMKAAADRKAAYYKTDEGKAALATKKEADKKFKEDAEEAAKIRSVEFDEAVAKGKQTASEGVDARQLELDRQAKVKADKELSDYQSSEEGKRKAQEEAAAKLAATQAAEAKKAAEDLTSFNANNALATDTGNTQMEGRDRFTYDPTEDPNNPLYTGGGTTGGGSSEPVVDTTERERRIAETATRVEQAAAGTGTVPKADVVKTGVDAEGEPLSNLTTSKDDIEEISERSATTAPDDITAQGISTTTADVTKADLKTGFSLSSFNDDIRQGVSKKFGTSVQAVKNKNGTFSLVRKDGSVAQTYPNSASMARDIGLNANTYMQKGAIDAAQVTAAKAGDLSATAAAQGSDPEEASVTEISSLTDKASAATAPTDEELKKLEAGTTTFAERKEGEDYAAAATDGKASSVEMPKVPLLDAEGNAVRNADGTVVMVDAFT